jgi:histidine ammonia-lyase
MAPQQKQKTLALDGNSLGFEDLIKVALDTHRTYKIVIKKSALPGINASRKYVEEIVRKNGGPDTPYVYGVNTGFGANKHKFVMGTDEIHNNDLAKISYNLIISHCCSVGENFPREVVRAAMLLRANTLIKGFSGIRVAVIQKLIDMLNHDITPVVPSQGSVGGSGDLAPLSHMAIVFIRNPYQPEDAELKGSVMVRARDGYTIVPATEGMKQIGGGVFLHAKEGLALNNGTQFTTALTALAIYRADQSIAGALSAASMTLEAMLGTVDAFNRVIHDLRPFPYQKQAAEIIRKNIAGSNLVFDPAREIDYTLYRRDITVQKLEKKTGLRTDLQPVKEPLQDIYSIRCTPQAIGAIWDAVAYVKRNIAIECNSANDNPIINVAFGKERLSGKAISGGNFHGEPVAIAADILKTVLTELGSLSERRTAALIHPDVNRRLPAFVTPSLVSTPNGDKDEEGMHSGMMIPQYVSAALTSENKVLAHPASVDTIPTSNGIEDHVSMGAHGAKQALQIAHNVANIVAVELLVAAQALELRLAQPLASLYEIEKRRRNAEGLLLECTRNGLDKKAEQCARLISELKALEVQVSKVKQKFTPGKGTLSILKNVEAVLHAKGLEFPLRADTYLSVYITTIATALLNGEL